MEQNAARPKSGQPLRNLLPTTHGFVAAVPSRVCRDGTGIFMVKLSHYTRVPTDSTCSQSSRPRARLPQEAQVFRELQQGLGAFPRAHPANRADESLRSPAALE